MSINNLGGPPYRGIKIPRFHIKLLTGSLGRNKYGITFQQPKKGGHLFHLCDI